MELAPGKSRQAVTLFKVIQHAVGYVTWRDDVIIPRQWRHHSASLATRPGDVTDSWTGIWMKEFLLFFFCFDFLILILIELKTSWLDQIECNSPIRVGKFRPAEICILRGISRTNLRIVIVGAETRKIVAFDCGIGFCNLIPILVWLPNPTKWIHGLNGFCNTNSSVVAKPYLLFQSIELGSAT